MKIHELLLEMPNLRSDVTGLPVNIWVSPGQSANFQHGPRLKIFKTTGKFGFQEMASIQIKKNVTTDEIIGYSNIPNEIFEKIKEFINKNYDTLIDFWNGKISMEQLKHKLIKV